MKPLEEFTPLPVVTTNQTQKEEVCAIWAREELLSCLARFFSVTLRKSTGRINYTGGR